MQIIYSLEPAWHKSAQAWMPAAIAIKGSMTKHMQQVSERCFQVKLLTQAFGNPRASEALQLKLSKYSAVMIREVYLLCDGKISMFARSLFPLDVLLSEGWRLWKLGENPLGPVLFSDPKLLRNPFEFAILRDSDADYDKATQHMTVKPDFLWARRSVFRWQGKKLMIEEVFLPDLLGKISTTQLQ